jgi:copper(I)-binding protein
MKKLFFALLSLLVMTPAIAAENTAKSSIVVSDAWVRASLGRSTSTAAYMKVENRGSQPDKLLGISVPAAGMAHLHESIMTDGIMQMRSIDALVIQPGASVVLAPGGLHVMIMNLKEPLKVGQSISVALHFAKAGKIEALAEVKSQKDPKPAHAHH